ncbi:uncharacterized protein LOC126742837 [Anthonomus grandis grandis]|uniref:uncharacterized protein LOC126742837 n=1 Tax=Anthonomus grandis grandis TaxID=2921223 RepID=UPI00216695D9|nr:uncharacterized protein LOC126742837 [Anthonomus grandis grandis]
MDKDGIMHVGGRLNQSNYNFNKKHPMLISSKRRLARLIFEFEHKRLMHAGPHLLLSSVREVYWSIASRNLAKAVVRKCLTYFRFKPQQTKPIMGDLPRNRLIPGKVFDVVGVDYMGPLNFKDKRGRGARLLKCYVSVSVCFITKVIHLEIVSDLSSEAFILALRRFVSHRGKPGHIYSDNGTNFKGANRELNALGEYLINEKCHIEQLYLNEQIQWHFIPVNSPHFGGLWEAGVKSSKHHLKRVVGNAHFTFEELTTLLAQIEATLNSRPLTPL